MAYHKHRNPAPGSDTDFWIFAAILFAILLIKLHTDNERKRNRIKIENGRIVKA